jgi:hypothetical protein
MTDLNKVMIFQRSMRWSVMRQTLFDFWSSYGNHRDQ